MIFTSKVKRFLISLFLILILYLFLPIKIQAKSDEIYKDGSYIYQVLSKEDKTLSLIGIEPNEDLEELIIHGLVVINGDSYTVLEVDINYSYYTNEEYLSYYESIEKVTIADNFIGILRSLEFAFPNLKIVDFNGTVAPREVVISVFNKKDVLDLLFLVPTGLEDIYRDVIKYDMNYYFGNDLYERSIPLTPTIVSKNKECEIEYGFFQKKGVLYNVTESASKKTGKVSIIGLTYAFRELDNSYLSLPEEVENNGYEYKVTHIAKFGLVGAKSKVVKLPHSIASMDSSILDSSVELLFLSKNCKTIPSNIIADENNESSLRFVSVPKGVTTIRENAFNQIPRNTSSIILPSTIKTIGNKSLYQFKLVTFLNKKPITNIKGAIKNGTTVKVAKSSITSYKSILGSKVTVVEAKTITKASKITLNKTSLSLKKNASQTLKATLTKGSNETIYFLSSNPDVVTVSSKGVIKGKEIGTAYIVAYTRTSGLTTKVKITVTK